MHSSQYSVEQHGVRTAALSSLEQSGQASAASVGTLLKMSLRVRGLRCARAFSHVALSPTSQLCNDLTPRANTHLSI